MPYGLDRFAFYGTLRVGGGALERLGIATALVHAGPCIIPGRLLAVSWYPGLVPGDGDVHGDLFAVGDPAVVATLDRFEGYDPADPAGSPYLRERVRLRRPDVAAWVYRWQGDPTTAVAIPSGDWLAHRPG